MGDYQINNFVDNENKCRYRHDTLILGFLFLFLLISLMISMVKAPFASAEAKQSTLTMSISSNDLSINIAPKATGTFGKSTSSTIGINTDNFTGYTLSIATTSSGSSVPSTSLSDADDNEIESINSSISEPTFSSSSDYNNKWGYRPSQYIVTDTTNNTKTTISNNTDFLPAPTTEGDLLDITNAPNAENNTYTLDFGARVDFNLVAGNYSRTMVIMAVANDIVYNINYDENTDDTSVANMPTINPQPVTMPGQTPTAGSVATLSNNIPTRTGYNFTGWCDTATTINTTTGGQTCSSTLYNAEGDYGIDQTIDGTNIRLYATWATNEYDITFKTSTGISKIEVKQDSTTKCTIENNATNNTTGSICKLNYTIPYTIEATVATGYSFDAWNNTTANGTIGNASLSTTTYSTGTDITTLTPTATPNTYTITLNNNGGTGGSGSTTATYDSTTLATITNPTKANTTGTRTISGFTLPSGNKADSASITWPSSGCTSSSNCKSTNNTTYAFNGWYKETGATNKIASNATTPVLQASTSYTDANGKWISTSNQTLYAGWTASAGAYSSVTLPQISKTGYTCGWTTTSTGATTITYDSGSSLTPSSNTTLYGVCTANKYTLTINFAGTGVSSVQVRTSSGTGGTLMGTVSTSGGTVSNLVYGTNYYLYPSFSSGYGFSSWTKTDSATGSALSSTSTENPYYTMGAGAGALTLTAGAMTSCDSTKFCVQYDGNGLIFPETGTQIERMVNNVNYNTTITQGQVTKYSHTSNVDNAGETSGATYANSINTTDTITIPGASSLNVTVYYDTESNYDWVSVYQSPFDISNTNDNTVSTTTGNLSGKLTGRNSSSTTTYSSWYTQTYTVSGDTVKFHFISDSSVNHYGYYAVVTAIGNIYNHSLASGEYTIPTSSNLYRFNGWSEDSNALSSASATYTNEAMIKTELSGNNGETKKVYAIYDRGLTIRFNPVSNSGTGTGTMNNQVIYTNDPQPLTANGFTAPSNMAFKEWNTSPNGNGTVYKNQATFAAPSSTSLGDSTTLYAIWKPGYSITFTMDSNTSSIVVKDANWNTVGTITASGQSLTLYQGDTYTIAPIHFAGYGTNTITKTTGTGTLSDNKFTIGTGSATINVTSSQLCVSSTIIQNLTISAIATLLPNVGSTATVCDIRDGEEYTIGKLADGGYWLLDNLALDLANPSVLNNMTESNTNASNTTLSYLKNGGGTTSDKYAITGATDWTTSPTYASSYSFSDPLVNLAYKDTVSYNTTDQNNSYKIGGYYNYCAASAGSYCYGNGTSEGTPSDNTTEDICPKGWRMPTGNSSGEYSALANIIYGSTGYTSDATAYANYRATLHLPLSGTFYNNYSSFQGSSGYYWSSTRNDNRSMYQLYIDGSSLNPVSYSNRAIYGSSIRCTLANSPESSTETITVNLGNGISSVSFSNYSYPTQTVTTSGNTVQLRKNITYTITATYGSNYTLSSWSTASNGTLGSTTSNPTTYTVTGNSTLTVYGKYNTLSSCPSSPMISTVVSGITYMQDINNSNRASILSTLTTNSTYQIKDNRDNTTYCISKLADGKLWLLDNLALDLTNLSVLNNMTESNTNASNTTLSYLKNGGGTTSDKYAITGVVNWTDSPTYASGYSYSDPLVNLTYKDTVTSNTTDQNNSYKIGGYYNYCAASAGSYCYGNGTSEGTSSGSTTEDICPKGWRMPTGYTSGEYNTLYTNSNYSTYANYRSALHLPLSGYFNSGSASYQGSYGNWWSSTRNNSSYMYYLYADTSYIYPTILNNRYIGQSVRCTLTDSSEPGPSTETITVNLSNGTSSVSFSNASYPTQTVTTSGDTVELRKNVAYTITATFDSNFLFSSWSTASNGTLGSTTSNPTTYTVTGSSTLTASSQVDPQYTLQNWNGCSALTVYDYVTLYDARDGEAYAVSKLPNQQIGTEDMGNGLYMAIYDYKCWIMDNLRLDPTEVDLNTLKGKTNASDTTLTYFKNGGGTISNKYPTSGVSKWTSGYSYSVPLVNTEYKDDYNDEVIYPNPSSYKYGTYYNYCAASAGSYCYGNGTSYGTSSGNASEDICPSGWQMPTGGSSGHYQYLSANGDYPIYSTLDTPLAGFFDQGWPADQEEHGYFWSSTRYNNERMYNLTTSSNSANVTAYSERELGFSVRCIKK